MNEDKKEIMLDLLCKKAIYGLSEREEEQLAVLQRTAGLPDQSVSFELAAAAFAAANTGPAEDMPSSLRERILTDAERHFVPAPAVRSSTASASESGSWFSWLGWAFAAAASIVLAFNLYYTRPTPNTVVDGRSTPTPEVRLTPAQERQRLIETAPDLARGTWGAGNVKGVTPIGDIVWSDERQAGYMRLSGLPRNDPNKETYQLWIFDETQSDKTPIDGGTFDINADGEVIVPIDAKLRPRNTKMYAVTVEKPGGVVVSGREKIVALAKRET